MKLTHTFVGIFAFAVLVVPSIARADQSTSFQLLTNFPNEASQNIATSTNYQTNDAGITWYQYPGTSTSFQLVHPTFMISSSSSSSESSSESSSAQPQQGAGGGRGGRGTRGPARTGEPSNRHPAAAPTAPAGTKNTTAPAQLQTPGATQKATTAPTTGPAQKPSALPGISAPPSWINLPGAPAISIKTKLAKPPSWFSPFDYLRKRVMPFGSFIHVLPRTSGLRSLLMIINQWRPSGPRELPVSQITHNGSGSERQLTAALLARAGSVGSALLEGDWVTELVLLLALIGIACGGTAIRLHLRERRAMISAKRRKSRRHSS